MAYARPRFAFLHATADAVASSGISAVTVSVAVASAAHFAKENLADYKPNTLTRLAATQTAFDVELDRGAGTLEAVDRLIIPPGHNLGATTLEVEESTTGAFAGEEVSLGTLVAPGAGVIDFELDSSTDRYLRLLVTGPADVYEFGELWYTRQRPLVQRGFKPGYSDRLVPQTAEVDLGAGVFSVAFAAARDELEAEIDKLDGTDLGLLDEIMGHAAQGLPLWYWRHDSASTPILVRVDVTKREQGREVPEASEEAWSFELRMRGLTR